MALLGTLFCIYIPVSGDFSKNWLHKKKVIERSEGNTIEWVLEPDGRGQWDGRTELLFQVWGGGHCPEDVGFELKSLWEEITGGELCRQRQQQVLRPRGGNRLGQGKEQKKGQFDQKWGRHGMRQGHGLVPGRRRAHRIKLGFILGVKLSLWRVHSGEGCGLMYVR